MRDVQHLTLRFLRLPPIRLEVVPGLAKRGIFARRACAAPGHFEAKPQNRRPSNIASAWRNMVVLTSLSFRAPFGVYIIKEGSLKNLKMWAIALPN